LLALSTPVDVTLPMQPMSNACNDCERSTQMMQRDPEDYHAERGADQLE
jgi:hypothetical protein